MRDDVELAADDAREEGRAEGRMEGREEERQRYFSERAALESNNVALRAEIRRLRMLLAAQGG